MSNSITNAIADYFNECQTLQPKTLQWYEQKLAVFSEWCEAEDISLKDINNRTIVNSKSTSLIPAHLERMPHSQVIPSMAISKSSRDLPIGVHEDDEYEEHVSEKAIKRIKQPKVDTVIIETFTAKHISALYIASQQEYNQQLRDRDELILDLFLDTGIRSNELCTLTIGMCTLAPRTLISRSMVKAGSGER